MKKPEDLPAFRCCQRMSAADQLVIHHASVAQSHRSQSRYDDPAAPPQTWTQHHRVEQIAFEPEVVGHRSIIEGTRKGRKEIDGAGRAALYTTPPRNLDHDLDLEFVYNILGEGISNVQDIGSC